TPPGRPPICWATLRLAGGSDDRLARTSVSFPSGEEARSVGRKQGTKTSRMVKIIGLVGLVALAATGCSADVGVHFGWPAAITPQGTRMRDFWMWAGFASLAVGAIVWGLTIWTVAFHRKRKGVEAALPRQFQYSGSLEFILVVVPLIIVSVLFYFT